MGYSADAESSPKQSRDRQEAVVRVSALSKTPLNFSQLLKGAVSACLFADAGFLSKNAPASQLGF
jgi:hypothetical protein